MARYFFLVILFTPFISVLGQNSSVEQRSFCTNLNKVFELAYKGELNTYDGTLVKQSALLPVPGYSIKLEKFALNYVDKDQRFVAKTNLNMDSVSCVQKLNEYKVLVENCLDSVKWNMWQELLNDDKTTVFFNENKQFISTDGKLKLSLAMVKVGLRVYTINLYLVKL